MNINCKYFRLLPILGFTTKSFATSHPIYNVVWLKLDRYYIPLGFFDNSFVTQLSQSQSMTVNAATDWEKKQ